MGLTICHHIRQNGSCSGHLFTLTSGRKYSRKRCVVSGFLTSEVRECKPLVTHWALAAVSGRGVAWAHLAGESGRTMLSSRLQDDTFDIWGVASAYLPHLLLSGLPPTLWVERKNRLVTKQQQVYSECCEEQQRDFCKCEPWALPIVVESNRRRRLAHAQGTQLRSFGASCRENCENAHLSQLSGYETLRSNFGVGAVQSNQR